MRIRFRLSPLILTGLILAAGLLLPLAGCARPKVTQDVAAFQNCGISRKDPELQNMANLEPEKQAYRIGPGDVLELDLPEEAFTASAKESMDADAYMVRVDADGKVSLPVVGQVNVGGLTVSQAESAIADAYYPTYLVSRPTIVAAVAEYETIQVQVAGAVEEPGSYQLRTNEQTLLWLLMKAGGIKKDGASQIRVQQPGVEDVVIPVFGSHFPSSDLTLAGGENVMVEEAEPQLFTVVGLVHKPGAYPYPSRVEYNLLQAIAMAGGANEIADPQFAKIYRKDEHGQLQVGCFRIAGEDENIASDIFIKPGDVVAIEHTSRTRTRTILAEVLRIGAGVNVGATVSPVP